MSTWTSLSAQQDLYLIQFPSFPGGQVKMGDLKGRKIIVYTTDASRPDIRKLQTLNTLAKQGNDSLSVIIVPVDDFGVGNMTEAEKRFLTDSLAPNVEVAAVSQAKREAAGGQHPLLAWLSHREQNIHYEFDYTGTGQALVINRRGQMYASLLGVDFEGRVFTKVISTP